MDQIAFRFAQGSTPRIELLLPFLCPTGAKVFVTFAQAGRAVLEYGMNGSPSPGIGGTGTLTLDTDDRSMLVVTMSQADTLSLSPGDVELQVRVKTTDGADTFEPLIGQVIKAHKGGVIA